MQNRNQAVDQTFWCETPADYLQNVHYSHCGVQCLPWLTISKPKISNRLCLCAVFAIIDHKPVACKETTFKDLCSVQSLWNWWRKILNKNNGNGSINNLEHPQRESQCLLGIRPFPLGWPHRWDAPAEPVLSEASKAPLMHQTKSKQNKTHNAGEKSLDDLKFYSSLLSSWGIGTGSLSLVFFSPSFPILSFSFLSQ